jgi:hypothetical protein
MKRHHYNIGSLAHLNVSRLLYVDIDIEVDLKKFKNLRFGSQFYTCTVSLFPLMALVVDESCATFVYLMLWCFLFFFLKESILEPAQKAGFGILLLGTQESRKGVDEQIGHALEWGHGGGHEKETKRYWKLEGLHEANRLHSSKTNM